MTLSSFVHILCPLALALVVTTGPQFALADKPATVTSARALAAEGLADFDAGRFDAAEKKLKTAFGAVRVPTIGLYRGRALVRLGRLVEASEVFLEVSRTEVSVGDQAGQEEAKSQAKAEREALLPRLGKLVVTFADPQPTTCKIDGLAISCALLAAGYVMDPGPHTIEASTGSRVVQEPADIPEGETRTFALAWREESPQPAPRKPDPSITPLPMDEGPSSVLVVVGGVMIGVGAAGLVVGAITAGVAAGQRGTLDEGGCVAEACFSDQADDVDAYNGVRIGSGVAFVAGGITAATGIVLTIIGTRPPSPLAPDSGPASLEILPTGTGLVVRGRFW